jgi:predicted nucleotidyltransferase
MRRFDQIALSAKDRQAVEAAARILKEQFPVEEVILFGSKARGDDTPESDIDLLVLTSRPLPWQERWHINDALYDVMLDHDVIFGLIVEPTESWYDGVYQVLPIRGEVERDGVRL